MEITVIWNSQIYLIPVSRCAFYMKFLKIPYILSLTEDFLPKLIFVEHKMSERVFRNFLLNAKLQTVVLKGGASAETDTVP